MPSLSAHRDRTEQNLEDCACVCGEAATAPGALVARDEVRGGLFSYVKCSRCGTERIARRPTAAVIGSYYPNSYYAYVAPAQGDGPSLGSRLKRLLYEVFHATPTERSGAVRLWRPVLWPLLFPLRWRTHLAFAPPAQRRVFEIGAATGSALMEFRAAGWDVGGCEPSAQACQVAQARGLTLQNCTAEAADLGAAQYECVIINNVFEHLHQPVDVLGKVHRALVPSGVLLLIVPNHASVGARLFGPAWPGYDPPRHLWGFTGRSAHDLLLRHGYTVDRVVHLAPSLWCWQACVAGTRRPGGSTPLRQWLVRWLPWLLLPVGLAAAALGRGDFIKVIARRA